MSIRSLTIGATVSGLLTLAVVSVFFSFSWVVVALSFPMGAVMYLLIELLAGNWRSV